MRPPFEEKIASEIAAKMFIMVKVITITGRLSMVAKTALTMPKKAPRSTAISKETKRLWVLLYKSAAMVAHMREALPKDISKPPWE